jgi:sulfur relay (sulfurtransferase) DsrC/TusE family protein
MFTIFTAPKKSSFYSGVRPADFFALLHKHNVRKIIDIRRSAAMCDNAIFQERVLPWCCEKENIIYERAWSLAPAVELFKRCDDEHWDMVKYAQEYLADLNIVDALKKMPLKDVDMAVFLCAEEELFNCHRWICAEAFNAMYPGEVKIVHLGLKVQTRGEHKGEFKGGIPSDIEIKAREYIKSIFS